ncbi:hypothetical protein PI125_g6637 [Phytophthora idaei]|nr:hypothetical protein PI125_g6637 [Phytophthora idaei]
MNPQIEHTENPVVFETAENQASKQQKLFPLVKSYAAPLTRIVQ